MRPQGILLGLAQPSGTWRLAFRSEKNHLYLSLAKYKKQIFLILPCILQKIQKNDILQQDI